MKTPHLNNEINYLEALKRLGDLSEDGENKLIELKEIKKEIETLNHIIKEAINLPKGIEPHSYSDYKQKK